jgi:hypothetical protein
MSRYSIVTAEQQHTAAVRAVVEMADMPAAERAARANIRPAFRALGRKPIAKDRRQVVTPR